MEIILTKHITVAKRQAIVFPINYRILGLKSTSLLGKFELHFICRVAEAHNVFIIIEVFAEGVKIEVQPGIERKFIGMVDIGMNTYYVFELTNHPDMHNIMAGLLSEQNK